MFIKKVRAQLKLSQLQLAILTGVSVATIRNHEQGRRGQLKDTNPALRTLLLLIVIPEVYDLLIFKACYERYKTLAEVRALLSLVRRRKDTIGGIRESAVAFHNPQFPPEKLGFRVTKVQP